jgi:hypothetical protein
MFKYLLKNKFAIIEDIIKYGGSGGAIAGSTYSYWEYKITNINEPLLEYVLGQSFYTLGGGVVGAGIGICIIPLSPLLILSALDYKLSK